jgi:hypothetical protein
VPPAQLLDSRVVLGTVSEPEKFKLRGKRHCTMDNVTAFSCYFMAPKQQLCGWAMQGHGNTILRTSGRENSLKLGERSNP